MPLSHPVDEAWLIELLNGLLEDPEREQLLAHIRGCPECEARMRALARERELVRAMSAPMVKGEDLVIKPRRRTGRAVALLVAVAAVVVVAIISMTSKRGANEQYWIPVAIEERTILRAAQRSDSVDLERALRSYERHDAAAAVTELERNFVRLEKHAAAERLIRNPISAEDVTATAIHGIFLASAQLNAGDPEKALKTLDAIMVESLPPPWRERGQWVQYLALEQLGKSEAAHNVLWGLQEAPGEIGVEAQKRLNKN